MVKTRRKIGTAILLVYLILLSFLPASSAEGTGLRFVPTETILRSVTVEKAIVTVVLKEGYTADAYSFQAKDTLPETEDDWIPIRAERFSVFKYDGEYDLLVRDTQGAVSEPQRVVVNSGYHYVIDQYDREGSFFPPLQRKLQDVLEEAGTTVEAFNEQLYREIAKTPLHSRESVAVAGVTAVSMMADLGYCVPYCANHSYQREEQWGFNPEWGMHLLEPVFNINTPWEINEYEGMHCVASCVWAYRQAGLALSNSSTSWEIGKLGEHERSEDNLIDDRCVKTGDLMREGAHFKIFLDWLDTDQDGHIDAFLSFEANNPVMCLYVNPYQRTGTQKTFLDMSAVFDDTSKYRDYDMYRNQSTYIHDAPVLRYRLSAQLKRAAESLDVLSRIAGVSLPTS